MVKWLYSLGIRSRGWILVFSFFALPVLNGQGNDSLGQIQTPAPADTVAASVADTSEHKLSMDDLRTLVRILRFSMEMRKTILTDYADLPVMKGWHPMIGYQYQGFSTMQAGIGYGHRHLFRPLAYTNAHINLVWAPNPRSTIKHGISAALTRSRNVVSYGLEGLWLRDANSGNHLLVRPEVGFSFLGAWNVGYGYNFFIGPKPADAGMHTFVFRYTQQFLIRSAQRKYREINFILNRDRARWEEFWREVKKPKP